MQAEQDNNNKAIAAQIFCAFLAHKHLADNLSGIDRSKPGDLEALWERIIRMVSTAPQGPAQP